MAEALTKKRRSQRLMPFAAGPEAPRLDHARNGNKNKLFPEDLAAHDWYRFVLSFPPQLVREYLLRFGLDSSHTVLDPFCGTGTTLVECKKQDVPSIGLEAHPMAAFASRVKTDWGLAPEQLAQHAAKMAAAASKKLDKHTGPLRRLPEQTHRLLLKDSISPLPLHKTLVLIECLQAEKDPACRDHELLALASALVFQISNLHFGPEVGVGQIKEDAPVVEAWFANVMEMAANLQDLRSKSSVETRICRCDARQMPDVLSDQTIDAVITSPPYPNEKDYTRTTRLETTLLGFIRDKEDLRKLKQDLVRSNTRNVYKADDDDRWSDSFAEIKRIADDIEKRRIALGKTSGFERQYARVTKLYFGGMARHFAELRRVLRPGARLAYVFGDQASYLRIMIRTGQLLAQIAESLGYQVESLDLFRTRLSTVTREQLREEVLVLNWPG